MARRDDRGAGDTGDDPKIKVRGPKKTTKGRGRREGGGGKGHRGKGRKGKGGGTGTKVKHGPKAGRWHEASGAATAAGHAPSASKETGTILHPAGKGLAPLHLQADANKGLGTAAGLGGVILDLVGEGTIKLSGVLAAWARESERITNRTWRRPGGLAKLGGL